MGLPDPSKRPKVGVSTLVRRGNRFLLAKRAKAPAAGLWSLPGGHVEFSESLEDAAKRELREETALAPTGSFQFGEYVEIIREGYHYLIMVFFVADDSAHEAIAGDDAAEIGWFTAAELDALDAKEAITPTTRDRIDRLAQAFDKPRAGF